MTTEKENKPKNCFVIAPIGEPESETRKRSDQVLKHIVRPAVEACGYKAERADEIDKPGIITSQVIQRVVDDPLVIADLTERNPNVFYELAIRHAIRKPLVQIIKKGERIPFDVSGTRTIHVNHQDLDSVDVAKSEITSQIKSLEKDSSEMETPISVSLDLQILRQSDKPEERSLADILAAVSDLRSGLAKMEVRLGGVDAQLLKEEFQSLAKSLRSRLDKYSDTRSLRYNYDSAVQPRFVRSFMHMSSREFPPDTYLLIAVSLLRDRIPWVYEAGMEAYRILKKRNHKTAQEAIQELQDLVTSTMHTSWSREMCEGDKYGKETTTILQDLQMMLSGWTFSG